MREILFRGRSLETGKWVYGYFVKLNDYLLYEDLVRFLIIPEGSTIYPRCEVCSPILVQYDSIGQWTGLVDKNGVKIFEGDIMRNAGNVVEYYGNSFCINGDSPLSFWTGTEVIGNIWDNPELVKK